MASESNEIITVLRIMGAAAYVSAMRAGSQSARELDQNQTRAERSAYRLGSKLDLLSAKAGRGLARAATVGATFGAGLVKMGLNFDAMIERSQIGIGSLVGDMNEAKSITKDVRTFALKAPLFGTDQMIKTAQQLIGAGYDAKNVVPYLTTFSDTLSALGRRPEDLQRMTYAFVQMMSKGQISAEELRGQLGEIFPAQKILAREMGLSTQDFAKKMKQGTFKGKKSIMLLLRGMEKDFGGSTERMATTFDGQLANIRENTKYTLGILFKPLFYYLEKDAFPVLQTFGDDVVATMTNASLTGAQKFKAVKQAADFWLMPIWDDFKNELGKVDWANVVATTSSTLAPLLGQAFGAIGEGAAKALWHGFWQSNTWGKAFVATIVISKLGLWAPLFGMAGKAMGNKMGREVARTMLGTAVGEKAAAQFATRSATIGAAAGRAGGKAAGAAFAAGLFYEVSQQMPHIRDWISDQLGQTKFDPLKPGSGPDLSKWLLGKLPHISLPGSLKGLFGKPKLPGMRAMGGPVQSSSPYIVGERGPELFVPDVSGNIKPSLGGLTLHNYMILDGRITAKSVAKHNLNELARR
jgi:tape measure domain-containing protein